MDQIHDIAVTGETLHAAMSTQMPMPNLGRDPAPRCTAEPTALDDDAPVNIQTIIGKKAAKPMVLESPIYISHMSFGALSKGDERGPVKGQRYGKDSNVQWRGRHSAGGKKLPHTNTSLNTYRIFTVSTTKI